MVKHFSPTPSFKKLSTLRFCLRLLTQIQRDCKTLAVESQPPHTKDSLVGFQEGFRASWFLSTLWLIVFPPCLLSRWTIFILAYEQMPWCTFCNSFYTGVNSRMPLSGKAEQITLQYPLFLIKLIICCIGYRVLMESHNSVCQNLSDYFAPCVVLEIEGVG